MYSKRKFIDSHYRLLAFTVMNINNILRLNIVLWLSLADNIKKLDCYTTYHRSRNHL